MEVIDTKSRLKCQHSPELGKEIKRKKNDNSHFFTNSWSSHMQLFSWMFLVLVDRKFAGDCNCKSLKSSKSTCIEIFGIL